MGADFVIASNVLPAVAELRSRKGKQKRLGIIGILIQSFHITENRLTQAGIDAADVVIVPQVADIAPGDFCRAAECISRGIPAAEALVPEIKLRLGL